MVPLGCGVENKINGRNKGRSDYVNSWGAWFEDLKRFSLYLDQKVIYLEALNKSGPLICPTDN